MRCLSSKSRACRSPALGGGGGGGMMQQIRQLQEEMARTQENLGDETVEVSVGGGVLQMVMTGNQRLLSVRIEPDILNADDVDMLQDLVVAAVNEAIERSQQLASDRMGALTGGLNLPGLLRVLCPDGYPPSCRGATVGRQAVRNRATRTRVARSFIGPAATA